MALRLGRMLALALPLALTLGSSAQADPRFEQWIAKFWPVAERAGISAATYRTAFANVHEPDPDVLPKADNQPEFNSAVWDYLDSRVNPYTVKIGRQMAERYAPVLASIERRFGVERSVVLAIWSMESNYGAVFEKSDRLHYVPRALATMAYADPSRAKYAKKQLIAALKILQTGIVPPKRLLGSWAGAMGHTQFIPTSYLLYASDGDGDGRSDIWGSVPDALATTANLLAKNGWQSGQTWGYEVTVPPGGAKYAGRAHSLAQWKALGFARAKDKPFPAGGMRAVLKLPAGNSGPGFLMTSNFSVLKAYNASDKYALAVGLLADQIAGSTGMVQGWPRPGGSLSIEEKFELQTRLKSLGYYDGVVDGNFGSGSKAAISALQEKLGLVADGQPSKVLLRALRQ